MELRTSAEEDAINALETLFTFSLALSLANFY